MSNSQKNMKQYSYDKLNLSTGIINFRRQKQKRQRSKVQTANFLERIRERGLVSFHLTNTTHTIKNNVNQFESKTTHNKF